jgi:hypothetical protein
MSACAPVNLQEESTHTDPSTLSAAYQLFRRQEHLLETCQGQRRWECPVCAQDMHSGHADGNMKLWTRKNDNKVSRESRYDGDQGAMFVADRWVSCAARACAGALALASCAPDSLQAAQLCYADALLGIAVSSHVQLAVNSQC